MQIIGLVINRSLVKLILRVIDEDGSVKDSAVCSFLTNRISILVAIFFRPPLFLLRKDFETSNSILFYHITTFSLFYLLYVVLKCLSHAKNIAYLAVLLLFSAKLSMFQSSTLKNARDQVRMLEGKVKSSSLLISYPRGVVLGWIEPVFSF